jgi:hypothetical protein
VENVFPHIQFSRAGNAICLYPLSKVAIVLNLCEDFGNNPQRIVVEGWDFKETVISNRNDRYKFDIGPS